MKIKIKKADETISLGVEFGKLLKKGDIIILEGSLGAGKTTFTKGIAKGIGIMGYVKSPTFTYVIEYEGNIPLYHFDLYRLQEPEELYDLGFDDLIDKGVIVMEWGNLVEELLLDEELEFIKLSFTILEDGTREITIGKTHRGIEIYKELIK